MEKQQTQTPLLPDNVAQQAATQTWPAWLIDQERSRARIMLMLLIPVSLTFLLTDLHMDAPERNLYLAMRLVYIALMITALVALFRAHSPVLIRNVLALAALSVALFMCVRYGLGHGASGVPGHLASDVVVILAIYMLPMPLAAQIVAATLVSLASAYGHIVWQGVHGGGAILLTATFLLTHALGLGGSLALRSSLRNRYEALRRLHGHMHDLDRAEAELERLAFYDPVTGLPNRSLFQDRLQLQIDRSQRQGNGFALFYIDLDRFKLVNDTLGHATGDLLLGEAAARMKETLRRSDTLARLSGDEFTLIVADARTERGLDVVATKIIESMQQAFVIDCREIFINASIGVSLYPDDGEDAATLIRNADTAMYRAKRAGRGRYVFYSPAMNAENKNRMRLESSLRRAIDRGEFLLHYQPRIDLQTRRINGFEALLRWQDPHEGLIPPGAFVPLAEDTGLIVPIGYWVIETACRQLRAWHDHGHPDLVMAINLSARQFQEPELVDRVAQTLSELDLPPDSVEFELTETILMEDAEWSLQQLKRLRALQTTISIDDFGVGYSSLSYLRRLPINALKIDRTFVADVPGNSEGEAIIRAVISLADALHLQVVAEGIETETQHDFLVAASCVQGQGFLYGRPSGAAEALRILEVNRRFASGNPKLRIIPPGR
jgi:diguanylate cyclase (GGDEF)-like protein